PSEGSTECTTTELPQCPDGSSPPEGSVQCNITEEGLCDDGNPPDGDATLCQNPVDPACIGDVEQNNDGFCEYTENAICSDTGLPPPPESTSCEDGVLECPSGGTPPE